jgi:hypothetical protein
LAWTGQRRWQTNRARAGFGECLGRGAQWQVAQLPPAQPEQPPPEDVAVRAPVWPEPVRVRQADMSFLVSPEAHLGQGGVVVAVLETISSNWAPHLLQQYSYMGMD